MKNNELRKIFQIGIIILFFGTFFTNVSISEKIDQKYEACTMMDEGKILFSPMFNTTTYLIDSNGIVNHKWLSSYIPGASVRWLDDGTILRTIRVGVGWGGGSGGGIQKVQWDGTILWDFRYNTNEHLTHHDVETLPNGNVLLIAWEKKSQNEAIEAGRNPNYVNNQGTWPDHIIEVAPTSPSSGDIVWEWHAWDHLIQDYDPSKNNYGVVGNHPELIDINYLTSTTPDLMHTNSIDYNEEFDQIMISVCYYNEIWIIDHSTTTEEAAGHNGGNSGKGGDILYRWGNPHAYRRGTVSNRKLFSPHDPNWIKPGCPGEGNILVFNNGATRPGTSYSSVDEIIPPVNEYGEYYLDSGSSYGPSEPTWIYTGNPPQSFFAIHLSGAQRLANGNTLICQGEAGQVFEVTAEGSIIWEYTNPYPTNSINDLFKVVYIPPPEPPEPEIPDLECYGSINFNDIKSGSTVYAEFEVSNIGGSDSILNWEIESYPDWGIWTFNPEYGEYLTPDDSPITVYVSIEIPLLKNTEFEGYITVVNINDLNDNDIIPAYIKTPRYRAINQPFLQFFKNHPILFPLIRQLLGL